MKKEKLKARIDELQAMWHREYMQRLKLEKAAQALCGFCWEDVPWSSGPFMVLIRTCGEIASEGDNIQYTSAQEGETK
jgi:hypothetical protein